MSPRVQHDQSQASGAPALAHAGRLPAGPDVGTARVGTADRGTVVELSLRVERGVVLAARYLVFGDAAALACAESACRGVEGLTLAQARALTGLQLAEAAGIEQSGLVRALTVEDALKAALNSFDD